MSNFPGNIGQKENIDEVLKSLIFGLKKCEQEYNDKAKENFAILEKLGFTMNDIPENLKQDLMNVLSDIEVMDFDVYGGKEHVSVNVQHVQESLVMDDELKHMELLERAAGDISKQITEMNFLLKRKLGSAEGNARHLDELSNEKASKELIFKRELHKKEHELKKLQNITKDLERPLFSYEEVDILKAEEKELKEEVATLEAKLAKYHNLPLDEEAAAQLLAQLKEELKKVDKEIKLKLSN